MARRKLKPDDSWRCLVAIIWAIEAAIVIERFPIGHVNAHRWPYSPYIIVGGKLRRPGHKR